MKKNKFEEHSCGFKSTKECEEELEEEGLNMDEVEGDYYGETKNEK